MDHIAHLPDDDLPGDTFHLVDPEPMTVGETLNEFAKAAHAPQFAMRVDPHMTNAIPKPVRAGLKALPTVKRIREPALRDLGIPPAAMENRDFRCTFDARDTQRALDGHRHRRAAARPPTRRGCGTTGSATSTRTCSATARWPTRSRGKRVLITGASSGIGLETALQDRRGRRRGAAGLAHAREARGGGRRRCEEARRHRARAPGRPLRPRRHRPAGQGGARRSTAAWTCW